MERVQSLVDNSVTLPKDRSYAVILGSNPSQGARSPLLWNSAFAALGMPSEMFPLDVPPGRLNRVLEALESDKKFMGGAVAVPHKTVIAEWLQNKHNERLPSEVNAIGAVNCLFRNEEGQLCGTNTDGEGALLSVKKKRQNLDGARVLLLGPGGAGKAVAAFLAGAVGRNGEVTLSARNPHVVNKFAENIGAHTVQWPPEQSLNCFDVVVNCTVVGSHQWQVVGSESQDLSSYSPLANLDAENFERSRKRISELDRNSLVFDIIYDPSPTKLLELAEDHHIETIDGSLMNLEQAVLAFGYAAGPDLDLDAIRDEMNKTRARL